jgi:hypothetical protein
MTEVLEVRKVNASALPFLFRHKASLAMTADAGHFPDYDSDPKMFGRAYHKAMEAAARVGRDEVDLGAIARECGVFLYDLRALWTKFNWDPKGYTAELPLTLRGVPKKKKGRKPYEVEIRLILDLSRMIGKDTYELVELKTERDVMKALEAEEHAQLIAGMLALAEYTQRWVGDGHVAYARRGDRAWSHVRLEGPEEHDRMKAWLIEETAQVLDQFDVPIDERLCRVDEMCSWCDGRVVCPGFNEEFRKGVALVNVKRELPVTTENFAALHGICKIADQLAKEGKKSLKAFLETHGAPIPDGVGKQFELRPNRRTEALKVSHVRMVLEELVADEETPQAFRDLFQPHVIEALLEQIDGKREKVDHGDAMKLVNPPKEPK